VEYKRVHGLSVVPKTDKAHQKLHRWIAHQREVHKQGSLPDERKKKLVEFGFEFQRIEPYAKKMRFTEHQEKKWDEMYAELCSFHEEHGHCIVPYNDENDKALARWVSTQRVVFGNGFMDDSRKQRLNEQNFTWTRALRK
jgi:dsDNA-binding SOS-regulon protein